MLDGDRLPGQQRGAPAESGGESDFRVLLRHQAVLQQLVERAVEVAAAIEETLGDGQRLLEPRFVWRANFIDEHRHGRVRGQQVREHRQELVAIGGYFAALDVEIEHCEELAVTAGVGDERAAAAVGDDRRRGDAVVRMAPQDHIDAAHARGELQVDVHAIVGQQHNGLCAFTSDFVDDFLQALFLDAEGPVGDEIARVRDRRVGVRLADNRDGHAVDGTHRVGGKHGVAEVGGSHILREEFDLAG